MKKGRKQKQLEEETVNEEHKKEVNGDHRKSVRDNFLQAMSMTLRTNFANSVVLR